jgi:hypothetical protein
MIFNKPSDITYSAMAQWIDSVDIHSCDKDKLVEYLYHLVYINTQQFKLFFNDSDENEDFLLYCVSRLLIRLNNNEEQKVKSIVNYIKTVLHCWKSEYIKDNFYGSCDVTFEDFNLVDFSDYLIDKASENDVYSYSCYCINVSDILYKHIKKIPRKKFDSEWSNIYLSCLLTLHDRLKGASDLIHKSVSEVDMQLLSRLIRGVKTKPPILYHLDDSFSNLIKVLVNELTHALCAEISYVTHSKVCVTDCMMNLVAAAYSDDEE